MIVLSVLLGPRLNFLPKSKEKIITFQEYFWNKLIFEKYLRFLAWPINKTSKPVLENLGALRLKIAVISKSYVKSLLICSFVLKELSVMNLLLRSK